MPQRPCTSSSKDRGSLKVAVFLRLGYPAVALPLTGTKDAGVEVSGDYPAHSKLGMEEYKDRVQEALAKLTTLDGPAAGTRDCNLVLLHDRDLAHTGSVFTDYAEQRGLKVVLLPPSCPDLTPMDATFFGSVSRRWALQTYEKGLGWPGKAQHFKKLLEEEVPEDHIKHWQAAVHACIQERGGHVERRLGRKH